MAYLASSGLCIGAIGCLSSQKTARLGNTLGLLGVGGGVAACLGAMGGDPALLAQTVGASAASVPCSVPLGQVMQASKQWHGVLVVDKCMDWWTLILLV